MLRYRPLFWLALFWILLLVILHLAGIPLRRATEAERYLAEKASASGLLRGRLSEVSINSLGQYSILLEDALFLPSEDGAETGLLKAGAVLVYFPLHPELEPGLDIEFQGTLHLFRPADNPGEYDPRAYHLALGLAAYLEGDAFRILAFGRDLPALAAFRVKAFLREGLGKVYTLGDASLLAAMLLGERGGLEEETQTLYEGAGLSHLLSVSGLHVSFWAAVLGRLSASFLSLLPFSRGRGFWSRRGFALLRALLAMGGVAFYTLICGSRIPVQRAGLMALLYQMALGLGFSFDLPSAWGAAVLAALIPAPYALFQSSFQLSFGCVFILGCLLPLLTRKLLLEGKMGRALLVPVLLQMGLLPLSLWHFFSFRSYSLIANLLAVPLAGLILGLGFLSALLAHVFLPLGGVLAGSVHLLLAAIRGLCRFLLSLPFPALLAGRPRLWQMLAYMGLALGGVAGILHIRRREMENLALQIRQAGQGLFRRAFREARSTALLLFLWLLAAGSLFFLKGEEEALRLTSLYVGQGDAQVLSLPGGRHYLLDGGGSEGAGERVILPYLRCRGIRRLEYILVSHPDSDHINGLAAVLQAQDIQVKGLLMPALFQGSEKARELEETAQAAGVSLRYLTAGDGWQEGDIRFSVLYPGRESQVEEDNENSLVLRLEQGDFSLLLPGDLGEVGESMMLHTYGEALAPVTVLKAGHHGSRFSTSAAFLEKLRPSLTLISCGRNNRYGHPAPETLERLAAAGSRVLRTDAAGAIELFIAKTGELSYQTFHETEDMDMKKDDKQNKPGKFSLAASILILAVGAGAMAYALIAGPEQGPSAESRPAAEQPLASGASGSSGREETADLSSGSASPVVSSTGTISWPATTPAPQTGGTTAEQSLSPRPLERNAGRGGPAQDPQAEGFWLDLPLTDQLYRLMAGDLTNNTDEADPFRCLSADFKQDLDAIAEAFAAGEMSKEAAAASFRGKSFSWPGDKLGLIHPLGDMNLRCYSYPGRDMALAKDRILLSNVTARHYLFIRVYYNPVQDAVRIYMVNGLVY